MKIDKNYILGVLKELLKIDSPTGFTSQIVNKIKDYAIDMNYEFSLTNKGMPIITIPGKDTKKTLGIATHIDTLGLMIRSIKDNGRLRITRIGGMVYPSLDSELCRIYTRDGRVYNGTIFSTTPSEHVYKDANTNVRNEDTLEVILDEIVNDKQDVINLGINNGDFIAIDPKTVITENGFIKSRFLDNKLSASIIFGIMKYLKDNQITPEKNISFIFSVQEEVGHGMSYVPMEMTEIIAVDMGCIGQNLSCTEMDVSICAKDASGPYDYNLTTKLINISKSLKLNHVVDIYPYYSSDISAAYRGGNDIKGALIGPGIFASHGYERSHYSAVENTAKLIINYIMTSD